MHSDLRTHIKRILLFVHLDFLSWVRVLGTIYGRARGHSQKHSREPLWDWARVNHIQGKCLISIWSFQPPNNLFILKFWNSNFPLSHAIPEITLSLLEGSIPIVLALWVSAVSQDSRLVKKLLWKTSGRPETPTQTSSSFLAPSSREALRE